MYCLVVMTILVALVPVVESVSTVVLREESYRLNSTSVAERFRASSLTTIKDLNDVSG